MKGFSMNGRTITLLVILLPLLLAFGYVAARSGPLAAVPVTVTAVESEAISPALFGIGVVEARYSYHIGPAMTGHVLRLDAHVGERVSAGQVLGDMDPVDMDSRIGAQEAAIKRAGASLLALEASVAESAARELYARSQAQRYAELVRAHTVSHEVAEAKQQEYQIATASLAVAKANLTAAREELGMLRADHDGLLQQRSNLRLVSPVEGLVVGRYVEPGSSVVAGQAVLEIIDPATLWVNVRFDQLHSRGLAPGLPATILLRSGAAQPLTGHVARVEPLADAVTEEILAKVVFDRLPERLPPVGELVEVTVSLPPLPAAPVVPNASIKRLDGKTGVWLIEDEIPRYVAVETGVSDLEGRVQITGGLRPGDRVVVYSRQELGSHSRVSIVERLVEAAK